MFCPFNIVIRVTTGAIKLAECSAMEAEKRWRSSSVEGIGGRQF
jgi:hypothetical protein